jgi:hypothetical protein
MLAQLALKVADVNITHGSQSLTARLVMLTTEPLSRKEVVIANIWNCRHSAK